MDQLPSELSIYGIGTDLVAVSRIEKLWLRFQHAFARRILSQQELKEFLELHQHASPVSYLAKRYAAKEAVAKAMGTGFQPQSFWLTDIGVCNTNLGKPQLVYSQRMQDLLQTLGVTESYISLSDEKDFALAFVVLVAKQ